MWRGRGRGGWGRGGSSKKASTKKDAEKKQTSQTGEDKRVWSIVREGKAPSYPLGSLIVYSFDPATDNYGMRVEKREVNGKVTTLLMKTVNLGGRTDDLYSNLSSVLTEIGAKVLPPNLVVVERQPPTNYWTVRLSQHTIAYYMLMTDATVVEVNPRTCLSILGCPTEQGVRKKWALWYSEQFLTYMGDGVGVAIMAGKLPGGTKGTGGIHRGGVKVDDMAITLCQIEALIQHWKGWFPPKTQVVPIAPSSTLSSQPVLPTNIPFSTVVSVPLNPVPAPLPHQWIQGTTSVTTVEKPQEQIMIDIPQRTPSHLPQQSHHAGMVEISIQATMKLPFSK